MVVPAAVVAMAMAKALITASQQNLAGEANQRSNRKATCYNRFVSSGKHSASRA